MGDHQFDSAALAGTALAGTLVIFAEPGPFDWMNGIVGVTLFSILLAYEKDRPRTPGKSFALATVIAFTLLLILGLVFELLRGGPSLRGAADGDSLVPSWWLPVAWIVLTPICYALDRRHQRHIVS